MVNKKTRSTALIVSSALCFGALAGGLLAMKPSFAYADETSLYSENFEALGTTASESDIEAKGWKGSNRSIVDASAHGNYVAATYSWTDSGPNNEATRLYFYTANPFSLTLDAAKTYKVKWELWLNPKVTENGNCTVMIQSGELTKHNSVVIFRKNSAHIENYATEPGLQLAFVGNQNPQSDEDGWFTVEFTMKGTSDALDPNTGFVFQMTAGADQIAELNRKEEPTIRISEFEISENEGGGTLYKLSEKITPGLVGTDNGVFYPTGFSTNDGAVSVYTEASGIEGKTLKAVSDFTENVTASGTELYLDRDVSRTLEEGKFYSVKFDTAHYGIVKDTTFRFEQYAAEGGSLIDSGEMKIVSASDVTYTDEDDSFFKQDGCTVSADNGVYTVEAIVVGQGGELKLSASVNAPDRIGEAGLYIDNISITENTDYTPIIPVEERTYKKTFSQNFDNVSPDAAGQSNTPGTVFTETGFAGTDNITIASADGVAEGNQCLKAVIPFYSEAEPYQKEMLYLDVSKVGSTSSELAYRYSMKVKPFGQWKQVFVGFQKGNEGADQDFIVLHEGGTSTIQASSKGGTILKNATTYRDGVFNVVVYLQGKDDSIFSFFNMQAKASEAADTGFYLDDFLIEAEVKAEVGLNKKAYVYNKTEGGDLSTYASLPNVSSVTLDSQAVAEENYEFNKDENLFVLKAAALENLSVAEHTLTVASSKEEYTCKIKVIDIYDGEIYKRDMKSLSLHNNTASDEIWSATGTTLSMQPAGSRWDVNSVTDGIKFTPKAGQLTSYENLFQTNGGTMTGWKSGVWNSFEFDVKSTNASLKFVFHEFVATPFADVTLSEIEIDAMTDRRVDAGEQTTDICWKAEDGENGWKHVTVRFRYTEKNANSVAYVVIQGAKLDEYEDAEITFSEFTCLAERFPSATTASSIYDIAIPKYPTFTLDMCEVNGAAAYTVTGVKCDSADLTATNDYTVSVSGGVATVTLTETFCTTKSSLLNQTVNLTVTTSKGNEIAVSFKVENSQPTLPAENQDYDKALNADLEFDVDLKTYVIDSITYGTEPVTVDQNNYNLSSNATSLRIKKEFLSSLEAGTYTFTLTTTSGAHGTFTVVITDSTPVFGTPSEYVKNEGTDFTVTLDVKGKDISKVELNGKALTATEYAFADSTLTVKKEAFAALPAGSYTLTVTTTASASITVVVKDVPPEIAEGNYTAAQDGELVLTVDLHDRALLSVTVDGEYELLDTDYDYADGKLTVKSSILSELAVGEHTVIVTTEGGSDECEFTLTAASDAPETPEEGGKKKGCGSSIAVAGGIAAATMLFSAAAFVTKRKKK